MQGLETVRTDERLVAVGTASSIGGRFSELKPALRTAPYP